ncbi:MAG TPA: MerR family transcriptional regulator [Candidatus Fournierella pullicola]|uniref:MerR family transcriptional regulator n=1 Tax=Candidatus Allofournierella pullicola TaxID=2838596 RepID=A0A9D1V600_9FIRM|nr:MerR family transcriptional regulator [Candidatus Fournierella pullicola]
MLYSMKEVCQRTDMNYETLKFYCNQGLVPNVKRDGGNRRVFDERDLAWLEGLGCLRRCGLSIREMQHYVQLCLQGEASIPERKIILAERRQALVEEMARLQSAVEYLDRKQEFYDEVLAGRMPYVSNLLPQK